MADWEKIKTEYLTTDCTQRDLSKKYHINQGTIGARASREDWLGQREQLRNQRSENAIKTAIKSQSDLIKAQSDSALIIHNASAKLASLVQEYLDLQDPGAISMKELRQAAAALRDVQDIQHIKSPEDLAEQKARIENLRRQADTSRESTIEVVWGEMPPEGDG